MTNPPRYDVWESEVTTRSPAHRSIYRMLVPTGTSPEPIIRPVAVYRIEWRQQTERARFEAEREQQEGNGG